MFFINQFPTFMKHLKKIHEYPIIIHDKNTFIYRCFFRRYAGPFLQIPRCVLFFVFSAKSNHPPILHGDEKQKKIRYCEDGFTRSSFGYGSKLGTPIIGCLILN